MSEPGPTSVPTSADPRSKRPTKRRALSPNSAQASAVSHLFKNPEREIKLPTGPKTRGLPPPPEIVANVQGSSAGAGSGEFHVYKASRRREYERLRLMDEEVRKEEEKREFEKKIEEMRKKDEEKTSKNRKKRMKKKEKKDGVKDKEMTDVDRIQAANRKKIDARKDGEANGGNNEDETAVIPAVQDEGLVIHDDD